MALELPVVFSSPRLPPLRHASSRPHRRATEFSLPAWKRRFFGVSEVIGNQSPDVSPEHPRQAIPASGSCGLHTQDQSGRRQLLLLLLSAGSSLTLAQFGAGSANASTPYYESEGNVVEEQIIRDLFGFDGLGKSPEEYALGKVVALAQAGDGAVVFLGVDGFELPLQLLVGPAEAMAVLTAVQERKSRRPVTHEAWGLSLAAVGWKVDRVVITGNEKDVFFSSVVLSNLSPILAVPSCEKKSVDMRPSDGIALALRCRAPLFIRRQVAEDLLGPKEELARKLPMDSLKQPGLQASDGVTWPISSENHVFSIAGMKLDSPVYCSWMRRLQTVAGLL